jgi:hypothetical protein
MNRYAILRSIQALIVDRGYGLDVVVVDGTYL